MAFRDFGISGLFFVSKLQAFAIQDLHLVLNLKFSNHPLFSPNYFGGLILDLTVLSQHFFFPKFFACFSGIKVLFLSKSTVDLFAFRGLRLTRISRANLYFEDCKSDLG